MEAETSVLGVDQGGHRHHPAVGHHGGEERRVERRDVGGLEADGEVGELAVVAFALHDASAGETAHGLVEAPAVELLEHPPASYLHAEVGEGHVAAHRQRVVEAAERAGDVRAVEQLAVIAPVPVAAHAGDLGVGIEAGAQRRRGGEELGDRRRLTLLLEGRRTALAKAPPVADRGQDLAASCLEDHDAAAVGAEGGEGELRDLEVEAQAQRHGVPVGGGRPGHRPWNLLGADSRGEGELAVGVEVAETVSAAVAQDHAAVVRRSRLGPMADMARQAHVGRRRKTPRGCDAGVLSLLDPSGGLDQRHGGEPGFVGELDQLQGGFELAALEGSPRQHRQRERRGVERRRGSARFVPGAQSRGDAQAGAGAGAVDRRARELGEKLRGGPGLARGEQCAGVAEARRLARGFQRRKPRRGEHEREAPEHQSPAYRHRGRILRKTPHYMHGRSMPLRSSM